MARFEQWAKFTHFRLVVAIDQHGSILRAANALGLAQPTASKLLQDLEDTLHAPLFIRSNRGAEATELGRELIRHGRLILAQLNHASQGLEAHAKGVEGHVELGTLLTASSYLLPATIAKLRERRPNITLKIVESTQDQLMPRLMSGELDLVIGRLSEARYRNDVEQEALYRDQAHIVARADHSLRTGGSLSLEQLRRADWILPPPETTLRRQFISMFNDAGLVAPTAAVESVSFLTNRMLLQTTDLLGIWPHTMLINSHAGDDLAILQVAGKHYTGSIGISRRRDALLSPAAEALIEELRLTSQSLAGMPSGASSKVASDPLVHRP